MATDEKKEKTTEAPKVITCRDCRWLKNEGLETYCPITKLYSLDSNSYCAWAERKIQNDSDR